MKFLYSVYLFVAGGFVYQMIEMAWRSRTHWSMFILGCACFLSVYPWGVGACGGRFISIG